MKFLLSMRLNWIMEVWSRSQIRAITRLQPGLLGGEAHFP